jgi:hypothetical protein
VSGKEGESGRIAVKPVMLLSQEDIRWFLLWAKDAAILCLYGYAIGGVVRRHPVWLLVNNGEWWLGARRKNITALRWSTVLWTWSWNNDLRRCKTNEYFQTSILLYSESLSFKKKNTCILLQRTIMIFLLNVIMDRNSVEKKSQILWQGL